MAKNILIFSDGTGQAGGVRPDQRLSNVYKLYRASRTGPDSPIDPASQIAFYDAGLGTDDDAGPALLRGLTYIRKLLASATGRGITRNITDCYEAILNAWQPGDRIFLFGFSRGAYTARCVAGVLNLCGVPQRGADGRPLIRNHSETRAIAAEAVEKVYEHGAGRPAGEFEAERDEQARRFRAKYGSDADGHGNVSPYFIGVFDTVASLGAKGIVRLLIWSALIGGSLALCGMAGWAMHLIFGLATLTAFLCLAVAAFAWFVIDSLRSTVKVIRDFPNKGDVHRHIAKWEMKNYDRGLSTRVRYARHAISIDETRADFPRVQWGFKNAKPEREEGEPEYLQQIWFAGNHSDIGGSYPEEESRLSDISLGWMLEQAQSLPHPLLTDASKLHVFPDPGGLQHCEIDATRDGYPWWVFKLFRMTWAEKPRSEAAGAPVHPSVAARFALPAVQKWGRMGPYRPDNMRSDPKFGHYYASPPAVEAPQASEPDQLAG